jgi:hypothetical protein
MDMDMELKKEFDDVLKKLNDIDLEIMGLSDTIKLEFYKYYKQARAEYLYPKIQNGLKK